MEEHETSGKAVPLKKFMCQKETLDFLRVYIDVTDEFVTSLHHHVLITDHEHLLIQKLRWPSNRNELLQALVKREWSAAQFEHFLRILRRTQPDALTSSIELRAQQFVQGSKYQIMFRIVLFEMFRAEGILLCFRRAHRSGRHDDVSSVEAEADEA